MKKVTKNEAAKSLDTSRLYKKGNVYKMRGISFESEVFEESEVKSKLATGEWFKTLEEVEKKSKT